MDVFRALAHTGIKICGGGLNRLRVPSAAANSAGQFINFGGGGALF